MRLWDKGNPIDSRILDFTVGEDHFHDLRLVTHDCRASKAHAKMLHRNGMLTEKEMESLLNGLSEIERLVEKGEFRIGREQEDCHTAIEEFLTKNCGKAGQKIHLGRSRNDQVLTALRLYEKEMLSGIDRASREFRKSLRNAIRRLGGTAIPGYTHMQKAMPTSVRIWLGSFDAALRDNQKLLSAVRRILDQSPLGTAAGFGVPVFAFDRSAAAFEMGFAAVLDNPMYAQMTRGMFEMWIVSVFTGIMFVMNKLASDLLLFSMEEFGFVEIPDSFCTGSSLMPQKRNPDVLECVRGSYSVVLGEECKIKSLVSNLMSGYSRDLQLGKGPLFRAFDTTLQSLEIMKMIVAGMKIDKNKCLSAISDDMLATKEAYMLVKKGMPFREAYRKTAQKYKSTGRKKG